MERGQNKGAPVKGQDNVRVGGRDEHVHANWEAVDEHKVLGLLACRAHHHGTCNEHRDTEHHIRDEFLHRINHTGCNQTEEII